jgi:hypothetical protein
MLQVDWVWSYAFGATFAAAAARQLEKEEKPFSNKWGYVTLFFLATFFNMSALYNLWVYPQWESMQVAATHADIPGWIVSLFLITNVTQGVLGYWITYTLIKKKNYYGAHVNWMVAWAVFWFILACGWDCTGYQRFLYDASVNNGVLWTPSTQHMGLSFFVKSNSFRAILIMSLAFIPVLSYGYITFTRDGFKMDSTVPTNKVPGALKIMALYISIEFGLTLSIAVIAAMTVIGLSKITGNILAGYLIGIPSFSLVAYLLLFRRKMPMYWLARQLFFKEPRE